MFNQLISSFKEHKKQTRTDTTHIPDFILRKLRNDIKLPFCTVKYL